jgi:nucleoid DNA-binding protein
VKRRVRTVQLALQLHEMTGVSIEDIKLVLNNLGPAVGEHLRKNLSVNIDGLGELSRYVRVHKTTELPRMCGDGVNKVPTPTASVVSFRQARGLKKAIQHE